MGNDDLVERALRLLRQPLESAKAKGPSEQQKQFDMTLPIQIGDRIEWTQADLTSQHGVVDFLHPDADGTLWVFCICPDGTWAAVNRRYLTTIEGERP